MKEQPEEITACTLECVVMPQGEVICMGKTIGWFKDLKEFLALLYGPVGLFEECPECGGDVDREADISSYTEHSDKVYCIDCEWEGHEFYTLSSRNA